MYVHSTTGDICRGELARITCPTMVVHGQKDPLVGQFHAEYINNNIKNSR